MPGLAEEMAAFGGGKKQKVELGKQLESFLAGALPDFTHMTVLMYMVREARDGCSTGDIAKFIGDPKKVIQAVLDRFLKLEIVRTSGGLFKKYFFNREGPKAALVHRLLKLWEHPHTHELILKRVLGSGA